MSTQETIEAIVLQRRDWRETDRIILLLTPEHGKIELVAKGARKSGSRLSAATEPFVRSRLHYVRGRKFSFLTQAQILDSHTKLRLDYDRLVMALALAELYKVFTVNDQNNQEVFELFGASLQALEEHSAPLVAMVWACLRFMKIEGILPSWMLCTVTHERLKETPAWIAPSAGGYVSLSLVSSYYDRFQVPVEVLIGLEKTTQLPEPPPRLRFFENCFRTLCPFLRQNAHTTLPALDVLVNYLEQKDI